MENSSKKLNKKIPKNVGQIIRGSIRKFQKKGFRRDFRITNCNCTICSNKIKSTTIFNINISDKKNKKK